MILKPSFLLVVLVVLINLFVHPVVGNGTNSPTEDAEEADNKPEKPGDNGGSNGGSDDGSGGGGGGCPPQWTMYEGSGACYKAFIQKSSWLAAEMTCVAEGGHLVSIENKNENDFVAHVARTGVTGTAGTWIGLYIDDSSNQQWKWSDGTTVEYTKWKKGDPDKPLTEKCVEMFPDPPEDVAAFEQWNSNNCFNLPHSFVCKKKG